MSVRQAKFICDLVIEIGWSGEALKKWLRAQFEADSIEALATSKNAQEAIRLLLRIKADRSRRQ